MEDISETMDYSLRHGNCSPAHILVKALSILNPGKRDGGFFTCFKYEDASGRTRLETDGKKIIHSCLTVLAEYSNSAAPCFTISPEVVSLPPVETEQFILIQKYFSTDKAMSTDGTTDRFFKYCPVFPFNMLWTR